MDRIKLVLKYVLPYKGAIFTNIFYNLLSAVFALISYTLAVPFLKVLFSMTVVTPHPGEFQMTISYLSTLVQYYLTVFIDNYGRLGALMIVCLVFLVASLLKNGFIFLSNNSMAYIRSSTVRDIRKNIYIKILRLPVGYFSDARKGDIMTRVSNDVQEIEGFSYLIAYNVVQRSDYCGTLSYISYDYELSTDSFLVDIAACQRLAYRKGEQELKIESVYRTTESWQGAISCGRVAYRSKDYKRLQC